MSISSHTVKRVVEMVEAELTPLQVGREQGLKRTRRLIRVKLSDVLAEVARRADGDLFNYYTTGATVEMSADASTDCAMGTLPSNFRVLRNVKHMVPDQENVPRPTEYPCRIYTPEDFDFNQWNSLLGGFADQPMFYVQGPAAPGGSFRLYGKPETMTHAFVTYGRRSASIAVDGSNDTDIFDCGDEYVPTIVEITVDLLKPKAPDAPPRDVSQAVTQSELATKQVVKAERTGAL